MYVDSCKVGKYSRHLLRESFRENGKVKHRTIANLSKCSEDEIQAIKLALRHKKQLASLTSTTELSLQQGLSVGAVWLVHDLARQLGIVKALGPSEEGKLALWQVIARVIDQGSRLSAVRLAESHAACDIVGIDRPFDEDHLYHNLDWLCVHQAQIEDRLFQSLYPGAMPGLFLYDVTSSYLEGEHNELAAFGYNRDGKRGKRQIVIGLLCDESGRPLSIEVFAGNTQDPATVASQIHKLADRFGGAEVTLVGDRGMIKSQQVQDLMDHQLHYITAITKPQIEALLKKRVIQMSLFDQPLAEVDEQGGVRYVLRRNPIRAQEMDHTRQSKLSALRALVDQQNLYLSEHPRAQVQVALRKVEQRCRKLKLTSWVAPVADTRTLSLVIDQLALKEAAKLDGCYVLKTDLSRQTLSKETVHDRYKDLSQVEWAFRTCKTVELEMRPIHVRLESRTRGHAFVVMLAYCIVQELASRWVDLDMTVEEGLKKLSTLCATDITFDDKTYCRWIPKPHPSLQSLLNSAGVKLPEVLPSRNVSVSTRRKLSSRRKKAS